MRIGTSSNRTVWISLAASLLGTLTGCGGGDSGSPADGPSISIDVPTSARSYETTSTDMRIGGAISNASFVHVRNSLTGFTTEGYVFYASPGQGTWFADVQGLGLGENPITATADSDGSGRETATAMIVLVRPLQPVNLIFNGPDQDSADSFWTDENSLGRSRQIALFGDGTGRSTTGSALSELAGATATFTWSMLSPDSIQILGCPTCSFQRISRISGSRSEEMFYGQIETTAGGGELALHVFTLSIGRL